jgi:hypothetical protein
MLKEQNDQGSIKPFKEISPNSLQNSPDSDATYRKKGNKKHISYTASIAEKFDDKSRMITQYELKKNNYCDQRFAQDTIKRSDK